MKKRLICALLVLAMAVPMAVTGVSAAPASAGGSVYEAEAITPDYFRKQLSATAQKIYDRLLQEFTGENREQYYAGTALIELTDGSIDGIDSAAVEAYKNGNKDLFNDFAAAKDALDLDHPELWWLDSGYLTFIPTYEAAEQGGTYHLYIGPGRGDTYLLAGKKAEDVQIGEKSIAAMDAELNEKIDAIVGKAKTDAATANAQNSYTQADKIAALVRSVHDQITLGLSYRYETDCGANTNEALFIRTVYAVVTQKGVCEAYSRLMELCLSKLGIQCVPVHGIQSKGTPENHMWNVVNIPASGGEARWYAVDATWDDPVSADYVGRKDISTTGRDGKENTNYLLVGQNVIGEYWHPSGYVSAGNFEFTYPAVETSSFNGDTAYGSSEGLRVDYSAGKGSMEDGTPAGVFTMTFEGKNMEDNAKNGLFFLLKMYDYHPDGTVDAMSEWYYAAAVKYLSGDNKYFGDTPDGLRVYTATCEYVEMAVTTRAPQNYSQWGSYTDWQTHYEEAYYAGGEDEIIAQSGLLYNANASYEAPPYVFHQTPAANCQATAGREYRFDVTFDDELYHPTANTPAGIDAFADNTLQAAGQQVRVRYTTIQQDLHTGGDMVVTINGDLPFDINRDDYVDMDPSNAYVDFAWHYVYGRGEGQKPVTDCPVNTAHDPSHVCDVNAGCRIDGVSFNFRASDLWQDDITQYDFQIEGVVGSRSGKFPNVFGVCVQVPGLCPACYRSQGIDWNLWGKPTLLDAPENLNLREMAEAGGTTDKDLLNALDDQINKSGFNGRLMLVVEDKSEGAGSREEYQRINDALTSDTYHVDENIKLDQKDIVASSVFEINFNRICPMVKLKPGDSLRVQVGYPAGITYEMLTADNAEVELKAYHFTRCDSTLEKKCKELEYELAHKGEKETDKDIRNRHAWGEHIVSVEEITLIPTPYGMVIMCDAFSPFEIVAVKKSANTSAAEEKSYKLVVVEGANGTVKVNDTEALGKTGNVDVKVGESVTITVEADDGYAVGTVALGGVALTPNEDGTYTVKAGNGDGELSHNDVLDVTFVSKQEAESTQIKGEAVVSRACTHSDKTKIAVVHEDGRENASASCTKDGYVLGTKCEECGTQLTQGHVVHATGHTPVVKEQAVDPTCTTDGKLAKIVCKDCGAVISDGTAIPAIGHRLEVKVTKEPTCAEAGVAEETCVVCGAHETVAIAPLEHSFVNGSCSVCGAADPNYSAPTWPTWPTWPSDPEPDPEPEKPEPTEPEPEKPDMTEPWVSTFSDVPNEGVWFTQNVGYMVRRGLMSGVGDGNFGALRRTTRKEATAILARLDGVDIAAGPEPWDVIGTAWAVEHGVSDGSNPNAPITREQFITMLWSYMDKPDSDFDLSAFADVSEVSSWALEAMAWGVENGLIAGSLNNGVLYLQPSNPSLRVHTAAFIESFCEKFGL